MLETVNLELRTPAHLDLIIEPLTTEIARLVGASSVILHLIDGARQELFARVQHLPGVSEIRCPIGQGVAGTVAQEAAALASHRVPDGARHRLAGKQGWMAVPVFASPNHAREGSVVGVLEARCSEQHFADEDLNRLASLAVLVSEALADTQLDDSQAAPTRFNQIIGQSLPMKELYQAMERAARVQTSSLLVGEAGTGKALLARSIHASSEQRRGPWISLCSATLPTSLLEHSLFTKKTGAIAQARGGTLFIGHITRLSSDSQARLAACLFSGSLDDTRLLASTRVPLEQEVAAGRFHPALAKEFRDNTIFVPSLRERGADDLSRLVMHWMRSSANSWGRPVRGIEASAIEHLCSQNWSGGLRELQLVVERAVQCCSNSALALEDITQVPAEEKLDKESALIPSGLSLAEAEKSYILRTLVEHRQNRTRAAMALGIGRNTLVRKLREYKNA